MASANFVIDPADPIYRDFTYINYKLLDEAMNRALKNYSVAFDLYLKYDNEAVKAEWPDNKRFMDLKQEAKHAADYWIWCHQGLRDLRFRDKYYGEMLKNAVMGLIEIPKDDQFRYKGYHDGFYFDYFRREDDPEWLRAIDSSWATKKIMFGPPHLQGEDLHL